MIKMWESLVGDPTNINPNKIRSNSQHYDICTIHACIEFYSMYDRIGFFIFLITYLSVLPTIECWHGHCHNLSEEMSATIHS